MKVGLIIVATVAASGAAAQAQSDHFAYDQHKAAGRAMLQRGYDEMVACVSERVPGVMSFKSRAAIKRASLEWCAQSLIVNGQYAGLSPAQARAMTAKQIDREIDALLANGQ